VTTFGISVFHSYERYAFVPQLVVFSILFGVSAKHYDLATPSSGDPRTVAGNRLSFFSICLSAAITYAGLGADYFVYWPSTTSRPLIFASTLFGLSVSFAYTLVLGVGLASAIPAYQPYGDAWTHSQGGSGSGALLVAGFAPLHGFGKFCAVVAALGIIANTIPPTYSAGVDFQILGRYATKVPRVVWNTIGVIIYTVCALAGRNHLAVIFTNFLALMGYWVAIWIAIILEEYLIFRRSAKAYNWAAWNNSDNLPLGIAALVAFLVGYSGSIISMAQVWYIGPIARLIGEYGGDAGNYVGFSWAALVYPPLRLLELKRLGR
jgi:purine-cytosine permease-like protein